MNPKKRVIPSTPIPIIKSIESIHEDMRNIKMGELISISMGYNTIYDFSHRHV